MKLRAMAVCLVVLGSAAIVSVPLTAVAAPVSMEYSADGGVTWTTGPPASWFDPAWRFVPGDTVTQTLVVRSLRTAPTLVQLAIANVTAVDPDLDSALTIEGRDALGAGIPATSLSDVSECDPVVPERILALGETMTVSLTMRLSAAVSGRVTQNSREDFDIALAMSDPGLDAAPAGCAANPILIPAFTPPMGAQNASPLAYTGSDLLYPTLTVGALALATGWLLVAVGRRRATTNDHYPEDGSS